MEDVKPMNYLGFQGTRASALMSESDWRNVFILLCCLKPKELNIAEESIDNFLY